MNTADHSYRLPLSGVESEHCALIVDKGLSKIEGITAHKVELNNKRAVIDTDDAAEVLPEAVKAIRDLGYGVDTIRQSFPVLNMSCASCAARSIRAKAIQKPQSKNHCSGSAVHPCVGHRHVLHEPA